MLILNFFPDGCDLTLHAHCLMSYSMVYLFGPYLPQSEKTALCATT